MRPDLILKYIPVLVSQPIDFARSTGGVTCRREGLNTLGKKYVSLLRGLYRNNGSVSYVVIYYGHVLVSPNITSVDGQFLIETETYSYMRREIREIIMGEIPWI